MAVITGTNASEVLTGTVSGSNGVLTIHVTGLDDLEIVLAGVTSASQLPHIVW